MNPEEIFGVNAGKIWDILKGKRGLSATTIAKKANLKPNEVYGALGWLGREGKIQIVNSKRGTRFKLVE